MNQYDQMYAKKTMTAEEAFNLLQDGDVMFSAQAAAEDPRGRIRGGAGNPESEGVGVRAG